ncbi:hypothetical protein [Pedobacter nutrimenti]|uniref:hypothetical protein n=1 Tax=Pedobacter nutrimenti TaxID=1241337 RepID=UPI00292E33CD|nr:hypothetical protein [Pedobacter nutrimenti]
MKKRYVYLLIIFNLCFLRNLSGQGITPSSIIGVWQVSTIKKGSTLLAHYQFFKDGKFIYNFNGYDDRGRITSAEGLYKLTGNKLLLYIKSRNELTGGELVQGIEGFQQEEIVLKNTKTIKISQASKEPIELIIEPCKMKNSIKCMKVQNNVYYQISKNPELK